MILLCIGIFFFVSFDDEYNKLNSKKFMPLLWILLIIYFIYQDLNLGFLVIILLLIVFFTKDKEQLQTIYNNLKRRLQLNEAKISTTEQTKESFENYEIEPYVPSEISPAASSASSASSAEDTSNQNVNDIQQDQRFNKNQNQVSPPIQISSPPITEKKDNAPFELDIREIKELYENIKSQIQQLK